jgi:hypothetical protein
MRLSRGALWKRDEPPRVGLIPPRLEMGTEAEGHPSLPACKIYAGIVSRRLPASRCRAWHKRCKCSRRGWECVPYWASGPRGNFVTQAARPTNGPMLPPCRRRSRRMRERRHKARSHNHGKAAQNGRIARLSGAQSRRHRSAAPRGRLWAGRWFLDGILQRFRATSVAAGAASGRTCIIHRLWLGLQEAFAEEECRSYRSEEIG